MLPIGRRGAVQLVAGIGRIHGKIGDHSPGRAAITTMRCER